MSDRLTRRANRLERSIGHLPEMERSYEIEKALRRTRDEALEEIALLVESVREKAAEVDLASLIRSKVDVPLEA